MDRKLLQTALIMVWFHVLSSMVAVDITPSRPVGVELGSTKLKAAIPDGWDPKQFDYNYNQIVPQKLQQVSSQETIGSNLPTLIKKLKCNNFLKPH